MSFIGPISGALVAGGFYYGISTMVHTRTEEYRSQLHGISVRLVDTPGVVIPPPSAHSRIHRQPFVNTIQAKWNEQIGAVYDWAGSAEKQAEDWTRKTIYGSQLPK